VTSDSDGAGEEQLLRPQIRLYDAVATGLAAILGAGIFAVVAPAAGIAGPALLISLLIAATVAFFNAMSSTQLARIFPRTGGSYHFGREMLGPWWGFMAGWMFLLANTLGPGVIAIAFGGYAHAAWSSIPARLAAVVMAIGVTIINASGIKRSVRVTDVVVLLSVLSLVAVVVLGLPHGDAAHFTPFAPHGAIGVLRATGLLFFAYTGYSRIATLVEEVHNPERVIPIATTVALGGAAILYILVATTAIAVLGAGALSHSSSPLRTTLIVAGVAAGPAIVVGGALVTTFNEALSDLLGVSRVAFAMARGGDLPNLLSRVDANQNPWTSVLFVGVLSVIVAALAPFTAAVMVSSFGILAYYLIANLSAFRLKPKDRMFPRWLAVAGFAGCLALMATLGPAQILIGLAAAAVGVLYRWIWLRASRASDSPMPRR
jgi:APA family basic amino acid/polyamine antiporter